MAVGLHHVCEGEGPPLLLLAGIGMGGGAWKPVMDRLSLTARCGQWTCPASAARIRCPRESRAGSTGSRRRRSASSRSTASTTRTPRETASGAASALELASRGSVASVTAFSPAGFASRPEQAFAGVSLRGTYTLARRIRGVAPKLFSRPRLRRVLCGQMFARPTALTPGEAYAHLEATLDGPAFHAVLEQLRDHRFDGPLQAPATIAWGTCDGLLWPTQALRARRALPEATHVGCTAAATCR